MPSKHPKRPLKMHPKRGKRAVKAVYEPFKMPKPDRKYGHSYGNIMMICKDVGISLKTFCRNFGRNTVTVDENGVYNYYTCDIERALFNATKGRIGVKHEWD
jgi:hypothetical protein